MTHKIIAATAVIVGLFALGGQTAFAAPMMCSGEKIPASQPAREVCGALIGDRIAGCRRRSNYCKRIGCWDNGTSRYCGLLQRQQAGERDAPP